MSNHDSEYISKKYLLSLTFGALGVVYGDIGTSPLYALRECFSGPSGIAVTHPNVFGILSLIVWALILVISVKYVGFVMRADNRGEGGNLALMALANPRGNLVKTNATKFITVCGLMGAAFLFGDGMITPAVSVLSAVEGIEIITPLLSKAVVPVTLIILFFVFFLQRHGTAKIGKIFGPVILLWFLVLAVLGVRGILHYPMVFQAFNPMHALTFLVNEGWHGFIVLGSVFLVATGGEALYADMGHFGKLPIRIGWFCVALPALVLNYFGQGAMLLEDTTHVEHPFFLLAPSWALVPLVILATCATVIASQAVISGVFSVTRQAVYLGYLPRINIVHTSSSEIGQIYVPSVNIALLLSTLLLVITFRTSSNLVAAYGLSVSTVMVITTVMLFFVARDVWNWKKWILYLVTGFFLLIDLVFWSSNIIKIEHGGWVPLVVASIVFLLLMTWQQGREILSARLRSGLLPLESFIGSLAEDPPLRVPGTAVFLSGNVNGTPPALLHHLELNKVLHEQVVLVQIVTDEVPYIASYDRVQIEGLGRGFFRIVAHYGFMESPNVPEVLKLSSESGFELQTQEITFFLGRETVIATATPGMAVWREKLFAFMSRNATNPSTFFKIPRNRVIELGIQVEM